MWNLSKKIVDIKNICVTSKAIFGIYMNCLRPFYLIVWVIFSILKGGWNAHKSATIK